jgi:hypothetical protein
MGIPHSVRLLKMSNKAGRLYRLSKQDWRRVLDAWAHPRTVADIEVAAHLESGLLRASWDGTLWSCDIKIGQRWNGQCLVAGYSKTNQPPEFRTKLGPRWSRGAASFYEHMQGAIELADVVVHPIAWRSARGLISAGPAGRPLPF